ncbi:MAG: C2 domain-containing protein [Flammeovirgaceae bacterium]
MKPKEINKKYILTFIIFLIGTPMGYAQFFSYEVIEGKEYMEAGLVHFQISYQSGKDRTSIKLQTQFPRNTKLPAAVAEKNSVYLATQVKVVQAGKTLYHERSSRYLSVRNNVYQADINFYCKPYKDAYELEAMGRFSSFGNDNGVGAPLFKIKLRVKPVYFDSYGTDVTANPLLKENYQMEVNTQSVYYPKVNSAIKIYVERDGQQLDKPAGYVEKEFKLVSTYRYNGKVIRTKSNEGSSLQTPFFHGEKGDHYFIKIIDKGLTIASNEQFSPGNATVTVSTKMYRKDKLVHKETKQVQINVPKFVSYTFQVAGAKLLDDGEKMFKHNSNWNNKGRDPLPDLFCSVLIDGFQVGKTAEAENTFSSTKGCTISFHYIPNKKTTIDFLLIDKDAFLNPDDLLLKVEKDLIEFLNTRPTTISDNYLGSFSIVH